MRKNLSIRPLLIRNGPLLVVLALLTFSFIWGWNFSTTKHHSWVRWKDQAAYISAAESYASVKLPVREALHYPPGYSLLGAAGHLLLPNDPFFLISLLLLLGSASFCFLAVRRLFGTTWAVIFSWLLFYWDKSVLSLHHASEVFALPWNNQVLFFSFSFYLWLLVNRINKPSNKVLLSAGLVSGLSFLTREESILFITPILASYAYVSRIGWRKLVLMLIIAGACFVPQIIVKTAVVGSPTSKTHDKTYSQTLSSYFRPHNLYRNTLETIVNSNHFKDPNAKRKALLQQAGWLWLSPIGIVLVLVRKRYPMGLKIFMIASVGLIAFYLSGNNMSAQKLWYHCLRYISPGFIALNLGVVIVLREIVQFFISRMSSRKKDIYNKATEMIDKFNKLVTSKGTKRDIFWHVLEVLPVLLPAAVAAFGMVAILLLLFGQLHSVLVWPLGLAAAAGASAIVIKFFRFKMPGNKFERRVCALLMTGAVIIWGGYNAVYSSQNVFVYRDPGIYTVTGRILMDQPHLRIDVPDVFGDSPELAGGSGGFGRTPQDLKKLFAQGLHLFPTLLGLTGRATSAQLMLHLNTFIGALALLVVYGFARMLAKPRWALLTTLAFSASLPFIYFSRDTYTEPLSIVIIYGALSLLMGAMKTGNKWLWALTGFTAGAASLIRADGLLLSVVLCAFMVAMLTIAKKTDRLKALQNSGLLLFGISVGALLGWLDATKLSSGYYAYHGTQMKQQIAAGLGILVIGLLLSAILWRKKWLVILDKHTRRWRGTFVAIIILLVAILLFSRPLWYVSHDSSLEPNIQGAIASMQQLGGDPIDPTRDYAENTVQWFAWYLGPVLSALGLAGVIIAAKRSLYDKKLLLLPSLLLVAGTSLVFMVQVGITPDQVWASRRFLPIAFPGVVAFGALGLQSMYETRTKFLSRRAHNAFVAITCLLMFVGPLIITWPYKRTQIYVPQLKQITDICMSLPSEAAVLWVGPSGIVTNQSTRAFCNVPAMWANQPSSINTIADAAKEAYESGRVPVLATVQTELGFVPIEAHEGLQVVSAINYEVIPSTLHGPPRTKEVRSRVVLLGRIEKDGSTSPLRR